GAPAPGPWPWPQAISLRGHSHSSTSGLGRDVAVVGAGLAGVAARVYQALGRAGAVFPAGILLLDWAQLAALEFGQRAFGATLRALVSGHRGFGGHGVPGVGGGEAALEAAPVAAGAGVCSSFNDLVCLQSSIRGS